VIRSARWIIVTVVLGASVGGCATAPSVLMPRGSAARPVATLTWFLIAAACVVLLVSTASMLVAVFRRRRATEPADRAPVDRTRWVVVGGAVIPAVILFVTFWWGTHTLAALAARDGAGAAQVEVIGHQWWWEIRYPGDGVVTANEMHIPVGRRVHLTVRSADVIHSFWVPQLGGKVDLIPGVVNHRWIEADSAGVYRGACAEYCGAEHARMEFLVVAQPQTDFAAWLQRQRQPAPAALDSLAAAGQHVFLHSGCASCHTIRGTAASGAVGPDLTHVAGRRTLAAAMLPNTKGRLAGWIANPQRIKPGNLMPSVPLTGTELQDVVAYLEALR
jgi:cytochrome c oxidase subunit 2